MEPTTKTWYPYLVVDITAFGDVKRATLICDSGAAVSVVHTNLLRGVKHTVRCMPNRKFVTANGEPIGDKLFATFEIVVVGIGKKIKLQDVLIMNSKEAEENHILMGRTDLTKAGVLLDYSRGLIKFKNGVKKVAPMSRTPMLNQLQVKENNGTPTTYSKNKTVEITKDALKLADQESAGLQKRNTIDLNAADKAENPVNSSQNSEGRSENSVNRKRNQVTTAPDYETNRYKMDRIGYAYHKDAVGNRNRDIEEADDKVFQKIESKGTFQVAGEKSSVKQKWYALRSNSADRRSNSEDKSLNLVRLRAKNTTAPDYRNNRNTMDRMEHAYHKEAVEKGNRDTEKADEKVFGAGYSGIIVKDERIKDMQNDLEKCKLFMSKFSNLDSSSEGTLAIDEFVEPVQFVEPTEVVHTIVKVALTQLRVVPTKDKVVPTEVESVVKVTEINERAIVEDLTFRAPREIEIIAKLLPENFGDGALVFFDEHKVVMEKLLQVMLVKTTDDFQRQAFSNARLVVACNQEVNEISQVPVFEIDNLTKVSLKAAKASVHFGEYKSVGVLTNSSSETLKDFNKLVPCDSLACRGDSLAYGGDSLACGGDTKLAAEHRVDTVLPNTDTCKSSTCSKSTIRTNDVRIRNQTQVLSSQKPILTVLTEQQRRKRRVVKSMSELRVDDNQYIIHLAECENGENPVIMVDDLHDAIPENQEAENCGEIAAGYDVNKLIRRSKRQNEVPDRLSLSIPFDGPTFDTQSYYEVDFIHLWVFRILCAFSILWKPCMLRKLCILSMIGKLCILSELCMLSIIWIHCMLEVSTGNAVKEWIGWIDEAGMTKTIENCIYTEPIFKLSFTCK